jgi:hypothetical protein
MSTEPIGSLYALQEVAEFPLEWAVVATDREDAARLLVVPADANPAAGSADLFLAPSSPGGPLSLRCAFATWLPSAFLDGRPVSGRLDPAAAADAALRVQEIEGGGFAGDPLGREMDRDPEYLDWIAEAVAPASQALGAARDAWASRGGRAPAETPPPDRRVGAPPFRPSGATPARSAVRRHFGWSRFAAAAALVAVLGLAWRVRSLERDVDRLSSPLFVSASAEVLLDGPSRDAGPEPVHIELPPAADHLLLTVVLGAGIDGRAGRGRLELQDDAGHALWRSPFFALKPGTEINVVLPRRRLAPASYRLALLPPGPGSPPIELRRLVIAAPPPAP